MSALLKKAKAAAEGLTKPVILTEKEYVLIDMDGEKLFLKDILEILPNQDAVKLVTKTLRVGEKPTDVKVHAGAMYISYESVSKVDDLDMSGKGWVAYTTVLSQIVDVINGVAGEETCHLNVSGGLGFPIIEVVFAERATRAEMRESGRKSWADRKKKAEETKKSETTAEATAETTAEAASF